MLKKFFLTMLGGIFATSIYAKDPKFNDYPVQVFKGKNAPLKLNSNTSNFKTRFRALANSKPNYAGHYVVDFFGCGGGCISGMAYNVKTGATQFLPFDTLSGCYTDDGYIDQSIDYQVNSKLFIAYGSDGSADGKCLVKYYVEQNGQLKLIKSKKWY
jgi:hypothetical protein